MTWWWKNKVSNKLLPDDLINYIRHSHSPDPNTNIDSIRFIILDTEASGLSKNAQIVSLGWVVYQSKSIVLSHSIELKMPIVKGDKSAEIHGETSKLISNQSIDSHVQLFIDQLKNSVLVGHCLSFDIHLLNRWLSEQYEGLKIVNPSLDTSQLALRVDPQYFQNTVGGNQNLQLDALCKKYHIRVEERHTALGDAYITAQLLHKLLQILKKKGCQTWRDLKS